MMNYIPKNKSPPPKKKEAKNLINNKNHELICTNFTTSQFLISSISLRTGL